MKPKVWFAGAMLVCSLSALADEPQKAAEPPMDPAMMEAMMKAITPNEHHRKLDAMTGTWNTKIRMWMLPGTDPMTSEGVSEMKMVMGGRYLEQRFQGSFMGEPFEGLGHTGYDNIRGRYWGTWMDSMSTSVMTSTGKMAEDGKALIFSGSMPDPMIGQEMAVEEKISILDADNHLMEMFTPGPDGKMFKMMEIAYSRKK